MLTLNPAFLASGSNSRKVRCVREPDADILLLDEGLHVGGEFGPGVFALNLGIQRYVEFPSGKLLRIEGLQAKKSGPPDFQCGNCAIAVVGLDDDRPLPTGLFFDIHFRENPRRVSFKKRISHGRQSGAPSGACTW